MSSIIFLQAQNMECCVQFTFYNLKGPRWPMENTAVSIVDTTGVDHFHHPNILGVNILLRVMLKQFLYILHIITAMAMIVNPIGEITLVTIVLFGVKVLCNK